MAATAKGTMPQATHNGELIPATACAAMLVLRDWPPGSSAKNTSGASALKLISAWRAVVPSAWLPLVAAPEAVASATVAKKAGGFTVLVRLPVVCPIASEPKLYRLPVPLVLSSESCAALVGLPSEAS